MLAMHNTVLLTEHTGAELFKMLLYECDSAALGILIQGIKNSIRWWLKFTTFVPVVRTVLPKRGKTLNSTRIMQRKR